MLLEIRQADNYNYCQLKESGHNSAVG